MANDLKPQHPQTAPPNSGEDEMVLDTSKMSADKRAAMEVAEGAREAKPTLPGFAQQLFMGTFDPSMLAEFPHQTAEDQRIGDELCDKVGNYLEKNLDAEEVDASRTIPEEIIDELFKMGVFAMKVPKEYGGLGLTQVNYNRVMMRISSYCASTAVLISAHQSIGVPQPLKLFGTEAQKKMFFPRFSKHSISAFALTEPSVGSDPSKMTTTATLTPDGKHYLINGQKMWITNGGFADVFVVFAKIDNDKNLSAFIVEKAFGGITMNEEEKKMGIKGSSTRQIFFNDCKVPVENLLSERENGFKIAVNILNIGRIKLGVAAVGG